MIFPVAETGKNLPAMQETWVWYLSQEDPLEKRMAIHSSILAQGNPMERGAGGLQSVVSQSQTQLSNLHCIYYTHTRTCKHTHLYMHIKQNNYLRYADDTTLIAESEEKWKTPLMKVKEESEKFGLKLNIQKTKIMTSSTIQFSSVQFSRSVMSDSLQPHESQYARSPCPSPTPGNYPNPCPSSRWCHPAISSMSSPSPPSPNPSQHQSLFPCPISSWQIDGETMETVR